MVTNNNGQNEWIIIIRFCWKGNGNGYRNICSWLEHWTYPYLMYKFLFVYDCWQHRYQLRSILWVPHCALYSFPFLPLRHIRVQQTKAIIIYKLYWLALLVSLFTPWFRLSWMVTGAFTSFQFTMKTSSDLKKRKGKLFTITKWELTPSQQNKTNENLWLMALLQHQMLNWTANEIDSGEFIKASRNKLDILLDCALFITKFINWFSKKYFLVWFFFFLSIFAERLKAWTRVKFTVATNNLCTN